MKKILLSLFFTLPAFSFALEVGSEVLPETFQNQFDESMTISEKTTNLFFTEDKVAADWMKEVLEGSSTKLEEKNSLYVSDISKMPSIVTKFMALPAMKKYSFKMALDQEGLATKSWPREKEKLTWIELKNRQVKAIKYLGSKEEIAAAVKGL